MDELLEILEGLHPEVDFSQETGLIDNKILDSFDIVSIVTEVNSTFDVMIPADALTPENFNSAEAIFDLITRLEEE